MGTGFRQALCDPARFVVTIELVPGSEAGGRHVDTPKAMAAEARDAFTGAVHFRFPGAVHNAFFHLDSSLRPFFHGPPVPETALDTGAPFML